MAFITVAIALFLLVALLGLWELSTGSAGLEATYAGEARKTRYRLQEPIPAVWAPTVPSLSDNLREERRGKVSNVCCPTGKPKVMNLPIGKLTVPVLLVPVCRHPQ